MRDAARSVKQNVQEGYRRKNDKEFLRFLAFSRGSLAELKGDIEDSREDDLISEIEFESLNALICKTDFLFNRLMQALSKSIQSRSMHVPVGRLGPSVPIGPKPC